MMKNVFKKAFLLCAFILALVFSASIFVRANETSGNDSENELVAVEELAYSSFAEAYALASEGDVITLTGNITSTEPIVIFLSSGPVKSSSLL